MKWQEITEAGTFDNTALKDRYNHFNAMLFHNALPDIPVTYAVLKSVGGVAKGQVKGKILVPDSLRIQISSMHLREPEAIDGLLIHEMVHIFFYVNGNFRENHGANFLRKLRELQEKVSFKIPLTDSVTGLVPATAPIKKVGVIILHKEGRASAAVVSEKYIHDNLEVLRKRWTYGVEHGWAIKVQFIVCTGRIELIYPIQRKQVPDLTYYIIKETALIDEALQNAEILATVPD